MTAPSMVARNIGQGGTRTTPEEQRFRDLARPGGLREQLIQASEPVVKDIVTGISAGTQVAKIELEKFFNIKPSDSQAERVRKVIVKFYGPPETSSRP